MYTYIRRCSLCFVLEIYSMALDPWSLISTCRSILVQIQFINNECRGYSYLRTYLNAPYYPLNVPRIASVTVYEDALVPLRHSANPAISAIRISP